MASLKLGRARAAFDGTEYGSEYLQFHKDASLLLLPEVEDEQGWAYGCLCGEPGWFPRNHWKEKLPQHASERQPNLQQAVDAARVCGKKGLSVSQLTSLLQAMGWPNTTQDEACQLVLKQPDLFKAGTIIEDSLGGDRQLIFKGLRPMTSRQSDKMQPVLQETQEAVSRNAKAKQPISSEALQSRLDLLQIARQVIWVHPSIQYIMADRKPKLLQQVEKQLAEYLKLQGERGERLGKLTNMAKAMGWSKDIPGAQAIPMLLDSLNSSPQLFEIEPGSNEASSLVRFAKLSNRNLEPLGAMF